MPCVIGSYRNQYQRRQQQQQQQCFDGSIAERDEMNSGNAAPRDTVAAVRDNHAVAKDSPVNIQSWDVVENCGLGLNGLVLLVSAVCS